MFRRLGGIRVEITPSRIGETVRLTLYSLVCLAGVAYSFGLMFAYQDDPNDESVLLITEAESFWLGLLLLALFVMGTAWWVTRLVRHLRSRR